MLNIFKITRVLFIRVNVGRYWYALQPVILLIKSKNAAKNHVSFTILLELERTLAGLGAQLGAQQVPSVFNELTAERLPLPSNEYNETMKITAPKK